MLPFKLSHVVAGFIAVLVGYTSSVAIIFQAIDRLGATEAQANSWMLVLGVGMGLSTLLLSVTSRMPVLTAWSTPGAALIALGTGATLPEATGAFLFCAVLLIVTGLGGWFDRLARLVPDSLANAMLAGILFSFGIKIFDGISSNPVLVGIMVATYLAMRRYAPRYAIAVVFLAGLTHVAVTGGFADAALPLSLARPSFVMPEFQPAVLIGLGLPLYLVTMSSQNMPGVATLRADGFEPRIGRAITVTGVFSLLLAPFGGYAFNLAAITAAICTGPDADEDPRTRWKAGVFTGIFYVIVGLMGAAVIGLFLVLPQALVLTIAALALLGSIGNSLSAALTDKTDREAALVTFMATASGFGLMGIGAPFWALLFGLIVRFALRR
ncbi:benzoate/H(+) symporter BenE family transporter [Paracoccus sp. PARArs4]|uniref:benzoate/H(+) symporter BenE family transporter n=1 Tax=Paracoccus sp. PARArs4 TaxID=2853442 RepID=UPI0024A71281|nr:benzoate/H(+) symporter BenE family transporter [Paracoccus sp. PARArs4]